jgi:hypothetical protein
MIFRRITERVKAQNWTAAACKKQRVSWRIL